MPTNDKVGLQAILEAADYFYAKTSRQVTYEYVLLRDVNDGDNVAEMTLEHYPGMTEKSIAGIIEQARSRWSMFDALVVHRVGRLKPTDQIVLVVVTGSHRGEVFAACEFIMDYLKTSAPFWKKEQTAQGQRWVEARVSDDAAAERWRSKD